MLAGMMAAILYFLSSPKIITIQSYATQQYSQKIAPQYPYVGSTCSQCGLSAASNAKFCSNCGKQLI
jgi:membrane protease subunit (stomatin/prohibitin family)